LRAAAATKRARLEQNLIGSTRETVTVALGQLKAQGCVAGGRCKVVITQPDRLAEVVNIFETLAF
jgi:CRP-like cAMP-binding protein